MPATTADRIRECQKAALSVGNLVLDAVDPTVPGVGSSGLTNRICGILQELWDSAYEAGRQDAAR